jgi:hypothetical protein
LSVNKCAHCGEDHGTETKFCPNTGKPVVYSRPTMMMFQAAPGELPGMLPGGMPLPGSTKPAAGAPPAAARPAPAAQAPAAKPFPAARPPAAAPAAAPLAARPAPVSQTPAAARPAPIVGSPPAAARPAHAGMADTEAPPDPKTYPPRSQADTEPERKMPAPKPAAARAHAGTPARSPRAEEAEEQDEQEEEPEEAPPPRRAKPAPGRAARAAAEEEDAEDESAADEEQEQEEEEERPSAKRKPAAGKRRDSGQSEPAEDDDIAASVFARASAPKKEFGQLIKETFTVYKNNLVPLVLTALVIAVPGMIVTGILTRLLGVAFGFLPLALSVRLAVLVGVAASVLSTAVIQPAAIGGVVIGVSDRLLGGQGTWSQYFKRLMAVLPRLLSALVPVSLMFLAVGGGISFLVPGLAGLVGLALMVAWFFFSFAPMIILIEGVSGPAALKRSFEMVKADFLRIFLVGLICAIIVGIVGAIAAAVAGIVSAIVGGILGAISGALGIGVGVLLFAIVVGVISAAALPISATATLLIYLDTRRKKDRSPNQLRDQLEELRG